MIYLDNATTSFPKPPQVMESIARYLTEFGVTPGRGMYRLSQKAEEMVEETRQMIAELIGVEKPSRIAFTLNATHALNIGIKGTLRNGGHALVCSFSHNSAIRPLEQMKRNGEISFDVYPVEEDGSVDLEQFAAKIKDNTELVIANHVSNVLGVEQSLAEIGRVCRQKGKRFLVDCTQSLGQIPVDAEELCADLIAGTGHKSLLGPSGVGFLYVRDPKELRTLTVGGSGGNFSISPVHPKQMPHKLEAGTLPTTAIAGLHGSLRYLQEKGWENAAEEAMEKMRYLYGQLKGLPNIHCYGPSLEKKTVPILAYSIDKVLPCEAAYRYDHEFGISLRAGIHCAPWLHRIIGTLPTGTLRVSPSHLTTDQEIDQFINATKEMVNRNHGTKKSCSKKKL